MTNEDIFLSLMFGGAAITAGVVAAVWVPKVIGDLDLFVKEIRFTKDLRSAINCSQPSWRQVCDLAKTAGISNQTAYETACRIWHSIITGAEGTDGVAKHRHLIETWIEEYRRDEPFIGLPDSTRVSLERLRADLGTNTDALHNITSNIRDLVKVHTSEYRRMKYATYASLPIGVGGGIFAIWSYLHPFTA